MQKIKSPLIAGSIGFILVFIINIVIGNTFFVTFLRSFIYGALVFGIFFGVLYYFSEFLGIDLGQEDQKNENTVDIVVGDEEGADSRSDEEIEEVPFESSEEYDAGPASDEDQTAESPEGTEDRGSTPQENGLREKEDLDEDDEEYARSPVRGPADDNEDIDSIESMESGFSDSKKKPAESDTLDDIEESTREFSGPRADESGGFSDNGEERAEKKSSDYGSVKSIKDAIGVDVSYDDVVKAIRTKLKEDR